MTFQESTYSVRIVLLKISHAIDLSGSNFFVASHFILLKSIIDSKKTNKQENENFVHYSAPSLRRKFLFLIIGTYVLIWHDS